MNLQGVTAMLHHVRIDKSWNDAFVLQRFAKLPGQFRGPFERAFLFLPHGRTTMVAGVGNPAACGPLGKKRNGPAQIAPGRCVVFLLVSISGWPSENPGRRAFLWIP